MNLDKKKKLASRTLKVGKERIIFLNSRLDEIKEAITKQDIRDLHKDGAILIREIKGKRKVVRKKSRSAGNVRKKVIGRKRNYIIMTRKLRRHASQLKSQGSISKEDLIDIRKKIRNKFFKSKSHLEEHIKAK